MGLLVSTRRAAMGAPTYVDKVLSYGPVVYWPQYEAAGAVADNLGSLGAPCDGAYTGVTLNNAVGPDGVNGCPFYDGANDYTDIYSLTLDAEMLGGGMGTEGSMMCWARVSGAGVWTDGVDRRIFHLQAGADYIYISRSTENNKITWAYRASGGGALFDSVKVVIGPDANWMHFALTWSHVGGDELKAYYNGAQQDLTQVGLAGWITNLSAVGCNIGSFDHVPTKVWSGWLAHPAMWDTVLTDAQIAILANPAP